MANTVKVLESGELQSFFSGGKTNEIMSSDEPIGQNENDTWLQVLQQKYP